jgi:sulfur carrier protein
VEVLLNSKSISIDVSYTLSMVIESFAIESQTMAVAVNEAVIPRSEWQTTTLIQGDKIDMFQAIAGG